MASTKSSTCTRSSPDLSVTLETDDLKNTEKTVTIAMGSKKEDETSRAEILCKMLASLLVLFFVIFHLVRVIRDGKTFSLL